MICALDVHYTATHAYAAAVVFAAWQSEAWVAQHAATRSPVDAYQPGQFYMRELAPLLDVIGLVDRSVDTFVIDGYCHLSADRLPGLGAYLHQALERPAVLVGVAKHRFRQSRHAVEVLRPSSQRPLFVTSIGIDPETAGRHVESMAGAFRMPNILREVDRLARSRAIAEAP